MRTLYPNSFLIDARLPNLASSIEVGSTKVSIGHIDVFLEVKNPRYLRFHSTDHGFAIYFGDRLHNDPNYLYDASDREWRPAADKGCLITYDQDSPFLHINSDFLGTEISYYRQLPGRVIISNRIDNHRLVHSLVPDFTGVYQFLKDAHTVGSRTLVKGIRQTRPLTTVIVNVDQATASERQSGVWRVDSAGGTTSSDIARTWRKTLMDSPTSVLMLSGGWDSRLMMAANVERFDGSYTHGDPTIRELRLAYELAATRLWEMTFRALPQSDYQGSGVVERCHELGHAFFPHWYAAAKYLAKTYDSPLTAGCFVEHVSGQYGMNSVGSGWGKLYATVKSTLFPAFLDRLTGDQARAIATKLLSSPLYTAWYLPNAWQDLFGDASAENREDVNDVLRRYQADGTAGIQEIFERFRMEHTGRQHDANQTKCGIPFNGYFHPYADSGLARQVLSIPFRDRVSYKLSRDILLRLDPDLLELPTAAMLIKAKRPIILQEASRGVRILSQKALGAMPRRKPMRLGWNDFQFLHESVVFQEYTSMLRGDFWPKSAMVRFLEESARADRSAYSILDMFGKILTVDHVLYGDTYV
jgi:hypothetical protein